MTVPEIIQLLVAIMLLLLTLSALFLLCNLLFSGLLGRTQRIVEQMPLRALLVGLVNLIFFGLLAGALFNIGQLAGLLGSLIVLIGLGLITLGLSALSRLLGERLLPGASPIYRPLSGALLLQLAMLAPLAGWLLVFPLSVFTGYGAVIIALIRRREPRRVDAVASRLPAE